MRVLRGHKGDVLSVVVSGGLIASAGYDKDIKVWHADSGKFLRSLVGHTSIIKSLCATTDVDGTSYLVSGCWDHTVRLWNMTTGEAIQILNGHENRVKTVALFVAVEIYVVSGGDDCRIILWSTTLGTAIKVFLGHTQPITCVAVSTGSPRYAASGSVDGTIRIWDLPSGNATAKRPGRSVFTLDGHTGPVSSLTFSLFDIARQIYSAGEDGVVIVWEYDSGQCLRRVEGIGANISSMLSISRQSDEFLLTTALDGTLRVVDAKTGKESKKQSVRDGYLYCMAHMEDARGTALVVGGADGFLRLLPRMEDFFLAQDISGQGLRVQFNKDASVASTNGVSRVQFQVANKRGPQRIRGSLLAAEMHNLPKITRNVRYNGKEPLRRKHAAAKDVPSELQLSSQSPGDVDSSLDLQITKSSVGGSPDSDKSPPLETSLLLASLVAPPDNCKIHNSASTSQLGSIGSARSSGGLCEGGSARLRGERRRDPTWEESLSLSLANLKPFDDLPLREAPKVLQRRGKPQTASSIRRTRQLPKIRPHKREFVLTVSQYVDPQVSTSANELLQIYSYPPMESIGLEV